MFVCKRPVGKELRGRELFSTWWKSGHLWPRKGIFHGPRFSAGGVAFPTAVILNAARVNASASRRIPVQPLVNMPHQGVLS
jgi:hypothetical protein